MHTPRSLSALLLGIGFGCALIATSMYALASSTSTQRDVQRSNDIRFLKEALTAYAADTGHFPVATSSIPIGDSPDFTHEMRFSLATFLAPHDPASPDFRYWYQTDAKGNGYRIRFCMETDTLLPQYTKGCDNVVYP